MNLNGGVGNKKYLYREGGNEESVSSQVLIRCICGHLRDFMENSRQLGRPKCEESQN